MGRRVAALCACSALLAGCGGSGNNTAAPQGPVYLRAPTTKCLKNHHYKIRTDSKSVGFIAFTSVGGGLRATKRGSDVIMAFGANGADAAQTLTAYRPGKQNPITGSNKIRQSPIFRYRQRRANVVILFAYRPEKPEKKAVYACLTARRRG